jgi:alkylation response protein AidB-like acyl-CoA dehydrogenase
MKLDLNDDQRLLQESFIRFMAAESTPSRVRRAELAGHDAQLWRGLTDLGAIVMRAGEAAGGSGASLLDAALLMEQAGRHLASGPLAEAMVAARLLSEIGTPAAARWLAGAASGEKIVTFALHDAAAQPRQLVPGGAVADAVLVMEGDDLVLIDLPRKPDAVHNLGSLPLAALALTGDNGARTMLARDPVARKLFQTGLEEWKLLTAATLAGISDKALELAAAYSHQRIQFGKPIGAYQGISHPLADLAADTDGAKFLVWRAIAAVAESAPDAAALVSMAYWWAARTSSAVVAQALHTFGGYGLSLEYDIQLYHRRAKALALTFGDPALELDEAGRRLWCAADIPLPPTCAVGIDFSYGEAAERLAAETRDFFKTHLTPELRARAHHSFEGHDWPLHRALGAARLLFPDWPEAHGGRGADPYEAVASQQVWDEFDWSINAVAVASMVGFTIIWFGSDALKQEVLPRIAAGEMICSLGYSEPGSGSDVFAAKTIAVRDGDHWIINGQKMWTSGANLASYVLLLTRTDPAAPKHQGITLFLVPLDAPGVEITPIFTYPDERTNVTFYTDVRIPDRYRLGEVNGGLEVMSAALKLEQGGAGFLGPHRRVLERAVAWAKTTPRGAGFAIDDPLVRRTLARVATKAEVSDVIFRRSLWVKASQAPDFAYGPMSKLFATEAFLQDATDLLDLTAPDSLLKGREGVGAIESGHRHAAATTIYGGTSEIQRSLVAERRLSMPRSR